MNKTKLWMMSLLMLIASTVMAQENKVIDKVIAVVGENAILYSDIENQYLQYLMQGNTKGRRQVRCQIFEEVLFAKLLLNQAQLDSIEISDDQVESEMDRRLQYFINQIGSKEKLEKYYNKSILQIKSDLRNVIKEQMLTQQVQSTITNDIKITPSEVKQFYKSYPKDSLPLIQSSINYEVITIKPKITKEEKAYARKKIEELRQRIVNGEDFATLASIYSEDPGSALKGGELGDFTRGVMYPEFEAAAFSLQGNEISPVIETEAGFHILQLIKRKGDYINVRHILIQKKVSPLSIQRAKNKMDSIYSLISSGEMTFEKAAATFSEDDYALNGGLALNNVSGNNDFAPSEVDKKIFFKLDKMDIGQISKPFVYQDEKGKTEIKILKPTKRTTPHVASLDTDYDYIQKAALNKKKSDAVADWIKKRAAETYIVILDDYFKKCPFRYQWL